MVKERLASGVRIFKLGFDFCNYKGTLFTILKLYIQFLHCTHTHI